MGARGLVIRADVPAAELRRLARREADRAAAARMYAIANALAGMNRAEAARGCPTRSRRAARLHHSK